MYDQDERYIKEIDTPHYLKEWFLNELDNYTIYSKDNWRIEFRHKQCDVTPHGKSSIFIVDIMRKTFHWYHTHPSVSYSNVEPLNNTELEYLKLKCDLGNEF